MADPMTVKDWAETAQAVVSTLAILVGGGWAARKYLFHKEAVARLELRVRVAFVGRQAGQWLVEVLALLENKGHVPHEIREIGFELRCLGSEDPLREGGREINEQVELARVVKDGSWTPAGQATAMTILPGVAIRYAHVARLPADASFVLLHGRLKYNDEHMPDLRADRLQRVPSEEPPAKGCAPSASESLTGRSGALGEAS